MGGEARRRARTFVAATTLAVLLLTVTATLVLVDQLGGFAERTADDNARAGVGLLASIGSRLPPLTPDTIAGGFTRAEARRMEAAVAVGQRDRILSDLRIWNRDGKLIYATNRTLGRSEDAPDAHVRAALAGRGSTRRVAGEPDLTERGRMGVLVALESLRDRTGNVYGVVETELPLGPIDANTERVQLRLALVLGGGALALWLLALPFLMRGARLASEHWVPGRRRLLRAFRRALDDDEIEMAFQPQIDPSDGTVHAVEALVRWRRDGVLAPPDSFLPVIEDSPLMGRLSDRVLCLALRELRRLDERGHFLRMAVNCSATDLAEPGFPDRVRGTLERYSIAGWRLTLEVTETAILEDFGAASEVLTAITQLGVEVAVDDFGTGHASIARLHALPVTEIKIDRSFMRPDHRSRSYVEAIASFGRSLGLRVVAEGVEDDSTLSLLAVAGCDLAQGYAISRPLPGDELRTWLSDRADVRAAVDA